MAAFSQRFRLRPRLLRLAEELGDIFDVFAMRYHRRDAFCEVRWASQVGK